MITCFCSLELRDLLGLRRLLKLLDLFDLIGLVEWFGFVVLFRTRWVRFYTGCLIVVCFQIWCWFRKGDRSGAAEEESFVDLFTCFIDGSRGIVRIICFDDDDRRR